MLVTQATAASMLNVSIRTIQRLQHAGQLPTIRVGRANRIPEKSVEDYLCQKTCCRPASSSAAENTMLRSTMEQEAAELAYGQRIAKSQLRGLKAG